MNAITQSENGLGKRKKPKVLFVQPKLAPSFWGMEYAAPFGGFKYPNPPLGVLTLAGIISPEYECEVRDENVGNVVFPSDADIVAISGTLLHDFHVERAFAIADYFRAQGKLICIGGPVANLTPDVCRPHCDVLFEGEGEYTWPQFLKDYEEGNHKDTYVQVEKIDMCKSAVPRIDLINSYDYCAGQIQTTRGCPFTCEFCDIIVVFGRKVRTKPIEVVMKEVQLWADAGQELIFFSDDNFVGNRPYAKELLRELIRFNNARKHPVYFYTQASIDMAKDDELLGLLRDANFAGAFIGIESPRKAALQESLKVQNVHTEDLAVAIHKIQSCGLFVSGGMIVGFDNDDKDIFDEQFEFLQRAGVVFAQLSLLEAMPKTPLWERMKQNGRLEEYRTGLCTNIKPLNMTYDELVEGYSQLIRRVYDYDAYLERYLGTLTRMGSHKFPLDRPQPRLQNLINLLKIIVFYVFTVNARRRKFFFQMIQGTRRINPNAWRWTVRYLCNFIHFHRYAYEIGMVVIAPLVKMQPPQDSPKQSVIVPERLDLKATS